MAADTTGCGTRGAPLGRGGEPSRLPFLQEITVPVHNEAGDTTKHGAEQRERSWRGRGRNGNAQFHRRAPVTHDEHSGQGGK